LRLTSRKQWILGIYREPIFSHNAIEVDRLILEESIQKLAQALKDEPYKIRILEAQEWVESEEHYDDIALILSMAQGQAALGTLRRAEKRGVFTINSVDSVLSCYRTQMTPLLANASVGYPRSCILRCDDLISGIPYTSPEGYWVKRGDVHAISSEDVAFFESPIDAIDHLKNFKSRNVNSALIQEHIPGNIYKFYWVKGGFFTAKRVYSSVSETIASSLPEDFSAMQALAEKAAERMGLQVCGGDCIVSTSGSLHIIDMNDWPSFRTCREEASLAIAKWAMQVLDEIQKTKNCNLSTKESYTHANG
jgi:glutathione synthase/RimK-type ligase-like ATP-grasp enzyme